MPQVIFYRELEDNSIIAFFPRLKWNAQYLTCYAHIGQHSGCVKEYFTDREKCVPCEHESEYQDLLKELVSIGYKDLKVKNCLKAK